MLYNYRTLLFTAITIYFLILQDFSGGSPFNSLFFAVFMTVLSPTMFFLVGISHKEIGYDFLNRIFGEYESNYAVIRVFNSPIFIL